MLKRLRTRISAKITLTLISAIALVFLASGTILLKQRASAIEKTRLEMARTYALFGARTIEQMLEDALRDGTLSPDEIFETNYRPITQGLLASSDIPRFHTASDRYLDEHIPKIQDAFLTDSMVVFAVLVDRNGYAPSHNSH